MYYPMLCLKIAGWVANSVVPDETPHSAAPHQGLHCLLKPVCLNKYGKYGMIKLDFLAQRTIRDACIKCAQIQRYRNICGGDIEQQIMLLQ